MKIYLIESTVNKELYNHLKQKHIIVSKRKLNEARVVIVNKVHNVRQALDIVDFALSQGIEVICIKNNFAKEHYVCNYLIQNGANYV